MKANTASVRTNVIARTLGTLALLCVGAINHADAQTPTFYVDSATTQNTAFQYTDLTKKDASKNSLYFLTNNWNPVGSAGVYNNHPVGVFYFDAIKDTCIFEEDLANMPIGAAFNVVRMPASQNTYIHTATAANTSGDSTELDNLYANSNPNALIWVTPNANVGDKGLTYDGHPVGVWYNGSRWNIFNEDGSAMPVGASFNVTVAQGAFASSFVQTATSSNSVGDTTFLDTRLVSKASGHILMVTPNWNPAGLGGTYDKAPIGVYYNSSFKEYGIFNEDGSPMPLGASFNVWVLK
jgi:hypothetical protein